MQSEHSQKKSNVLLFCFRLPLDVYTSNTFRVVERNEGRGFQVSNARAEARAQARASRPAPFPHREAQCCSNHVNDVRWKRWLTSSPSASPQPRGRERERGKAIGTWSEFLIHKTRFLNQIMPVYTTAPPPYLCVYWEENESFIWGNLHERKHMWQNSFLCAWVESKMWFLRLGLRHNKIPSYLNSKKMLWRCL